MQEYSVPDIIIPKDGIKIIFLDESGKRKSATFLTQEDIQLIVRNQFVPEKQSPKPPLEEGDTSIKT